MTWLPISEAPLDGTVIEASFVMSVRYKAYHPKSEQRRKGVMGRWQVHNSYGWENCEEPTYFLSKETEQ